MSIGLPDRLTACQPCRSPNSKYRYQFMFGGGRKVCRVLIWLSDALSLTQFLD